MQIYHLDIVKVYLSTSTKYIVFKRNNQSLYWNIWTFAIISRGHKVIRLKRVIEKFLWQISRSTDKNIDDKWMKLYG